MRVLSIAVLAVLVGLLAVPASAITVSGIMVYTTDQWGNPNGGEGEFFQDQLWRTRTDVKWYGLGVLAGLPPDNIDSELLGTTDFSIQIPLATGDNDFTILGQPALQTGSSGFHQFAISLYFDGILDRPGICVLFPRQASKDGDPPIANGSGSLYSFADPTVRVENASVVNSYTDGTDTVTVSAVSFLSDGAYGDYDRVSEHAPVPGGPTPPAGDDALILLDYVGVLKLHVEGPPDARPMAGAPAGFGVVTGPPVANVGGIVPGGGMVVGEPSAPSANEVDPRAARNRLAAEREVTRATPNGGVPDPTIDAGTPTPDSTGTAAGATPTPPPSGKVSASRTGAPQTPTPAMTAVAGTATARSAQTATAAVTSHPAVTPTPPSKPARTPTRGVADPRASM